jgi:hypothetical protein
VRAQFDGLPAELEKRLTRENAAKFYGIS